MLTEIEVKYRNGLPTKKSMNELIFDYFGERLHYKVSLNNYFGKKNNNLNLVLWSDNSVQDKILGFIDYLSDYDVFVTDFNDYKSPRVGSFNISKANIRVFETGKIHASDLAS